MHIAMIGQKGIKVGEAGGGIERHVANLSKQLVGRGHTVTVYARKRYGIKGMRGVTLRFLPTIYRKNFEAIIHTTLATFDALSKPYDIIHYHGVGPSTLAWIPRLFKPKARVITTFHSQDRYHGKWSKFAKMYLHFGEWAACWFPNATIAVSHTLQVYARNHYFKKIHYIPNGADVETVKTKTALKQFGLTPGKYLVNVSRLIPHKGQHYLIHAFQNAKVELKSKMKGWKLILVGTPVYTSNFEKELKQLASGDDDIVFAGFQDMKVLRQLYTQAYLYVHPSESEGLAMTVIEAMSHGTPVLVSDIPENLESIDHAGFSFKNKNVRDLTEKIVRAIKRPSEVKKAAARAQNHVLDEYSWEMIGEKTESLYFNILD